MFSFLVHFYDLIVIWRTPILVKQLSAAASKQKEDKFTKFFVIVILCISLFLFLFLSYHRVSFYLSSTLKTCSAAI